MKTKLDVHTHTLMSGHAYSTLQEMVAAATEHELAILGVVEHTPGIPGSCDPIYFRNLHVVPRLINGVELMLGAEINVIDYEGSLDLDVFYLKHLELRIAGFHSLCYTAGTKEQDTAAMVTAIRNPYVQIISHPCDGTTTLDLEEVVRTARDCGVLLEVNNSSLDPRRGMQLAYLNNKELLSLSMKYDHPLILGSDAHISYDVANYSNIHPLLEELNFPTALLINDKPDLFKQYLAKR